MNEQVSRNLIASLTEKTDELWLDFTAQPRVDHPMLDLIILESDGDFDVASESIGNLIGGDNAFDEEKEIDEAITQYSDLLAERWKVYYELPVPQIYEIEISRIETKVHTFKAQANNRDEAEDLAMDMAGDYDYGQISASDVQYII